MNLLSDNSALLQLEETLHILEDSLQDKVFYHSLEKHYIKRLKQLYSPRFDIEHSETGSYYHATLQCIKVLYLDTNAIYQIPLSSKFISSMNHLLELNNLALESNTHHAKMTDTLLSLSELWGLHATLDIADLLMQSLTQMRTDLINTNERNIIT